MHHLTKYLWVRWIYRVYTKGADLMSFNPPIAMSWFFKKICYVRDKFGLWISKDKFSIQGTYMSYFEEAPKVS